MGKRGIIASISVGALFLPGPRARAWGPLEHEAIALAADHHLTPDAKAAVESILGNGATLDRIAPCADDILYARDSYDCGGLFFVRPDIGKATIGWHYIDIPIWAMGVTAASVMGYCPNAADCVVAQIPKQQAILADPRASRAQKQVALMFYVHLMGDLYQPLHCINDDPDDWAGGKKALVFRGAHKNLHSLWDDFIMTADWQQQEETDPSDMALMLEKGMTPLAPLPSGALSQIALESWVIARDRIYPAYWHAERWGILDFNDAIDAARWQTIARERMTQAADELAAGLNAVFSRASAHGRPALSASTGVKRLKKRLAAGGYGRFE